MEIRMTILMLLTVLFFSCEKGQEKENFRGYLTLEINEPVVIPNSNKIVTFKELLDDNRCPQSSCHLCYGSFANIRVSIKENETVENIELSIIGCVNELENGYNSVDALGYKIELIQLSPYPDGETINTSDYVAKLKITKL